MDIYGFDDDFPKRVLRDGGVIAFPTETVFGLGVRFDYKESFDRLIKIKERPADKPFTMMIGDKRMIYHLAHVDESQARVIERLLPGEITVILKRRLIIPDYVTLGGDTIGFRVPGLETLRRFLDDVGVPLLVPSANKSGKPPVKDMEELSKTFDGEIDCAIEGRTGDGTPSTVVSLVGDKPLILRQGKVTLEEIEKAFYDR